MARRRKKNPVPPVLTLLIGAAVVGGGIYLWTKHTDAHAKAMKTKAKAKEKAKALPEVRCVPGQKSGHFQDKNGNEWVWEISFSPFNHVMFKPINEEGYWEAARGEIDYIDFTPDLTTDEELCQIVTDYFIQHGLGR